MQSFVEGIPFFVRYIYTFLESTSIILWGRSGLMVSALDSGASAPGSSPGWGHCVVFLCKTLHSHSASLHP